MKFPSYMLFTRSLFGMSRICPGCQGVVDNAGASEIFPTEQKNGSSLSNIYFSDCKNLWSNELLILSILQNTAVFWTLLYQVRHKTQSKMFSFFLFTLIIKWENSKLYISGLQWTQIICHILAREGIFSARWKMHFELMLQRSTQDSILKKRLIRLVIFENSSVKWKCIWTWKEPSREGLPCYRTFRLKDIIEKIFLGNMKDKP